MKKKIGDLTINQVKEIKDRCGNYVSCKECEIKDKACYIVCNLQIIISKDILEQEIEGKDNG